MGSVRKLQVSGKTVKSNYIRKELAPDKGKYRGMILGAYIPWRSPMRFYYAKTLRKINVKRHMEGQRNFYSYYHRRYIISREHGLKAFELSANPSAGKRMIARRAAKLQIPKHEIRRMAERKERRFERKQDITVKPEIAKPVAKQVRARENPPVKLKTVKIVRAKEVKIHKTKRKPEKTGKPKPEIVKCVKKPRARMESIVVENPKIQKVKRVESSEAKPVSESVKSAIKTTKIYKTRAIKGKPRTSAGNLNAETCARGEEGRRHFTSNQGNGILPVRRPFTFFELSIKAAKNRMPPEEIIRHIEEMPEVKTSFEKPKEKSEKPEEDIYHITNHGRKRLLFPKIASGAADSLS